MPEHGPGDRVASDIYAKMFVDEYLVRMFNGDPEEFRRVQAGPFIEAMNTELASAGFPQRNAADFVISPWPGDVAGEWLITFS